MAGRPCLRWVYGVTTVPERRADLLPNTLRSLAAAGFGEPRLFVDGGEDGYGEFKLQVTYRFPRVGAVGNWILALMELLIREPTADRYAIFQDDIACSKGLRGYLERSPWPGQAYLNLITFESNQKLAPAHGGWFESRTTRHSGDRKLQTGYGAVALVFDRPAVLALLADTRVTHRPVEPEPYRTTGIDAFVVNSLNNAGFREWVHSPSLVGHTGMRSTMGNAPHPTAGTSFKGEAFDLMEVR